MTLDAIALPAEIEQQVEKMLTLPEAQRLAISDRLRESVPPRIDPQTLAEWKRRVQEIDDGVDEGIPVEEALKQIRESLREARTHS